MSSQDTPPLQRTGRGGAGNYHSTTLSQTPTKDLRDTHAATAAGAHDLKYVHHGRGGAGNLLTTSEQVKPVASVVEDTLALPATGAAGVGAGGTGEVKVLKGGRGGAGNILTASQEPQEPVRKEGEVDLEAGIEEKDRVQEPPAVHLADGRAAS